MSEPTFRTNLRLSPDVCLGILGLTVFFGVWEIISRTGLVNSSMVPPPSLVASSAWTLLASGELERHVGSSLWRAAVGFISGMLLALVLGVAMARVAWMQSLLNPLMQIFRAIPSLAFVPLAIFWFGIGEGSKIFLIAWGVFFPVWISAYLGARDTNPLLMRAGASLGAKGWKMLLFITLPAALPFIIAGIRVSLSVALVVLVAAELTGAQFGVGYLIQMSQQTFRVDYMFVGLVTLGLMGFLADYVFNVTIGWLLPWYGAENRNQRSMKNK